MYSSNNLYVFSDEIRHPFSPSYEKVITIKGKKYLSAIQYLNSKNTDNSIDILRNLSDFYSYKLLKDNEFKNLLNSIYEDYIVFVNNSAFGGSIIPVDSQVQVTGSNILGKILTCLRNYLKKRESIQDLHALTVQDIFLPNIDLKQVSYDYTGGSVFLNLTTLIYLLQKYPNSSTIVSDSIYNALFGIWWLCEGDSRVLLVPDDFNTKFQKILDNPEKRFIIIPLLLRNRYKCQIRDQNDDHSNILLYDKETGILERFEPHGSKKSLEGEWFQTNDLDNEIKTYFKDIVTEYLTPKITCPLVGPQIQENLENILPGVGFCTIWSFWYIDLRLSNPEIDRILLQALAISKIRSESQFLTRYIYSFAKHLKSFEDQITNSLPQGYNEDDEVNAVLEIIRKLN